MQKIDAIVKITWSDLVEIQRLINKREKLLVRNRAKANSKVTYWKKPELIPVDPTAKIDPIKNESMLMRVNLFDYNAICKMIKSIENNRKLGRDKRNAKQKERGNEPIIKCRKEVPQMEVVKWITIDNE